MLPCPARFLQDVIMYAPPTCPVMHTLVGVNVHEFLLVTGPWHWAMVELKVTNRTGP